MSDKLAQKRQACADMMEEVSGMLAADHTGKELQNCKAAIQAIADKIVQNEFAAKQAIKGTSTL